MSTGNESITLGADVGGKDAHLATHEHILALRKLLRQDCHGVYSYAIKEFALVLRVDGEIQAWGKSGVDGVKMGKKNSFVTADIFVPKEVWSESAHGFREFIASGFQVAIEEIIKYAQGRGVDLSAEILRRDVGVALEKYLAA